MCAFFCGQDSVWLGAPLVLEIDHVNGDNTDDRIENLRFLCPNCHGQTPTYKHQRTIHTVKQQKEKMPIIRETKINWPERDELENLVKSTSLLQLGKLLGVSDKAVAKRCKRLGIELKHNKPWDRSNISRTYDYKYSDEEIIAAVKISTSFNAAMELLVNKKKPDSKVLKKRIIKLGN